MAIARSSRLVCALAVFLAPAVCAGQDLTPRAYFPAPESSNAIIVTYAFSDGELLFDPTLPVSDATGTIHAPAVSLFHAFNFLGRSATVTGSLPFADGHFEARVRGEDREASRTGIADTVVRVVVNLVGAPSLSVAEFVKTPISRSLLGASIKMVAPTGHYDPTRLVNIGANRWGFKPEIGYTRRTGPLIVDAFAGVWFFTTNDSFAVSDANPFGSTRRQAPIGAFELHVSYDVRPRLWISADINYWRGGRTSVNGVEDTATLQANSRFGVTGSLPLTRRQALKVSYSDGVIVRIGGSFRVLSVGWQYGWIGRQWK